LLAAEFADGGCDWGAAYAGAKNNKTAQEQTFHPSLVRLLGKERPPEDEQARKIHTSIKMQRLTEQAKPRESHHPTQLDILDRELRQTNIQSLGSLHRCTAQRDCSPE
jgi:hypothetical protein